MWQITKMDIISTLIGICNKILHDHSCSADLLTKRREALFILGEAYYAKCGDINVGLEELTNKVGMQSGMFGGHGDADPTADGKGPSDEAGAKGEGNQITICFLSCFIHLTCDESICESTPILPRTH